MNILRKVSATLVLALALGVSDQDPWLHVYYPKGTDFAQFPMTEVLDITFDQELGTMSVNTATGSHSFVASRLDHFEIGINPPSLRITTDPAVSEIYSKEIYLDGTLKFEGMGVYTDFELPIQVRGRGNSTWNYPKKPYRIKFNEKTKLGSLKKAKNYVLLANYIDPSMMRNFVAFKTEELLGMDFPNHAMPVNVWFNGDYKGSYMASEKVGFNNGSVDIPAEQEARSIMFEFDTNDAADDEFPFESECFDYDTGAYLPVRIKDPDAPTDVAAQSAWVEKWQNDLAEFMSVVEQGNVTDIFNACDIESLVRYIITFNICCNQELNHPKSVFMYKTEGGKYMFGPGWDFDWAFGYQPTYIKGISGSSWGWGWEEYPSYENPLMGYGHRDGGNSADGYGGLFFHALCNNQVFLTRYREVWTDFYNNRLDEFWSAFDAYAELLKPSANLQGTVSARYQCFDDSVEELREWVRNRIEFINTDPNYGLWEGDGLK